MWNDRAVHTQPSANQALMFASHSALAEKTIYTFSLCFNLFVCSLTESLCQRTPSDSQESVWPFSNRTFTVNIQYTRQKQRATFCNRLHRRLSGVFCANFVLRNDLIELVADLQKKPAKAFTEIQECLAGVFCKTPLPTVVNRLTEVCQKLLDNLTHILPLKALPTWKVPSDLQYKIRSLYDQGRCSTQDAKFVELKPFLINYDQSVRV